MKSNWISIDDEKRSDWEAICPVGEYRVIQPKDVPSIIPRELVDKGHSFLVMAFSSPNGTVIYMVNINRIDKKERAIDQEPCGIAFVGNEPVHSGCFIHHGNWKGRTRYIPEEFIDVVSGTALAACYSVTSIPSDPIGKIKDLEISSQRDALHQLMETIRPYTADDSEEE